MEAEGIHRLQGLCVLSSRSSVPASKRYEDDELLRRIDAALKSKEMNLREIAEEYGLNRTNLSASLSRWRKRNA